MNKGRRRYARLTGFTLVELLVAISVLAIVAVLGWRGLDSIVRARIALNADLAQTRGLQLAFAQMQSDALALAPRDVLGNRSAVQAEQGRLTLVRLVFAENQPSRLQVVAYRLRDGVLSRRESPATRELKELDGYWSRMIGDSDDAPRVALQANVSDMIIRSWATDGRGWRMGTDETANARPQQAGAPVEVTGLEVSLRQFERDGSLVKVFLLGSV